MRPPLPCAPGLLQLAAALLVLAMLGAHPAQAARRDEPAPTVFAPAWDALVGRWSDVIPVPGTRDADVPPAARGTVTFDYELDGRVLVRRRVSDLAADHGRPPVHHEDLMTVYPAPDGVHAEAMYFDSEGHVVHYAATWASDERTVVFLSFPEESAPRMKLTWHFEDADALSQVVEVAAPGTVAFRRFDAGTMRRMRQVEAR